MFYLSNSFQINFPSLPSVSSFTASDRDPTSLAVNSDGLSVVGTIKELLLVRDNQQVASVPISYQPTSANFHPSRPELAIGGKVSKRSLAVIVVVVLVVAAVATIFNRVMLPHMSEQGCQ